MTAIRASALAGETKLKHAAILIVASLVRQPMDRVTRAEKKRAANRLAGWIENGRYNRASVTRFGRPRGV
jgi:hypothetical protein